MYYKTLTIGVKAWPDQQK